MVIGFTGRAVGVTQEQVTTLETLVLGFLGWEALHNDGVGSDQMFAKIATACGLVVKVTPEGLSPMPRNRHLVAHSDVLIALPPSDFVLKKGSGTWETIKYMWR